MWMSREVANVDGVKVIESKPGLVEETLGAKTGFFIKGRRERYGTLGEAVEKAAQIAKRRKRY